MRVTVHGPNLPRHLSDKGTIHVHKDGCRDIKTHRYPAGADQGGYGVDVASIAEIVEDVYPASDFQYDPDDEAAAAPYRDDIYVAPCVTLPERLAGGSCPHCNGRGWVTSEDNTCEGCEGTGEKAGTSEPAPLAAFDHLGAVQRALGVEKPKPLTWSEHIRWTNSEGVEAEVHLRLYAEKGESQFDVILTDPTDTDTYGRRAIVNITPEGARQLRDALEAFLRTQA